MGDHADDLMWEEMSRLIDPDDDFFTNESPLDNLELDGDEFED